MQTDLRKHYLRRGIGTRAQLDDQGLHAGACRGAGPLAGARVRYDRLVRVAAEIGLQCGISSRVHDGPIFDMGPSVADRRKRPADWFERGGEVTPADTARYYGGRCCDLTITTGGVAQLEAAEKEKYKKYGTAIATNQDLALTVFGVSYTGAVGEGGLATMRRWAACLGRQRKLAADLPGMPLREVVSAFSTAFALVVALQTASYIEESRGSLTGGKRAVHWQRDDGDRPKRRPVVVEDEGEQNRNVLVPQARDGSSALSSASSHESGNSLSSASPTRDG